MLHILNSITYTQTNPATCDKIISSSFSAKLTANMLWRIPALGVKSTIFVKWSSAFIPKGKHESGKGGAPILKTLTSENFTSNECG